MYERAVSKQRRNRAVRGSIRRAGVGPVAFMHRPSAMDNPLAPIGHHWQDATHIRSASSPAGVFTQRGSSRARPSTGASRTRAGGTSTRSARLVFGAGHRQSERAMEHRSGYGYLKVRKPFHRGIHSSANDVRDLRKACRLRWPVGDDVLYGGGTRARLRGLSSSVLLESEAILDQARTPCSAERSTSARAPRISSSTRRARLPAESEFGVGQLSLGYIRELFRCAARHWDWARWAWSTSCHHR